MAISAQNAFIKPGPISNLRWRIGALLFASTVINYIDRQTLSLLAPYLKQDYHWTNTDYANIVIAFRLAYSIGQTLCGRLVDRMGTRRGLTISVTWYSIVSILTSLANGFYSFVGFRFLLGAGESANWPGATKAVSEWFPKRERGLATALFDSGSSIGGAIAPFIVLSVYSRWGWRLAFVIPGVLGFLWRTIIARSFTDPVWFFVTDWFPIYLVAKGISLKSGLIAVWVPFIAADLGNFVGGGVSGYLLKRGWSLGAARKALVVFGGTGVLLLIPTVFTVNLFLITLLFGFSTFSYACFTTIANVLPSDLFRSESVASVSGLSGTGAGIGTIVAFMLIGHFSDARVALATHAFDPIVVTAGVIPFIGMILVLLLVRNTSATDQGLVRRI